MPETNWTTSVIHIATDAGMVRIAAKVLGPIAVHFGVGSMAGRICITHIGTGCRIGTADDAEGARNLAEALAREDWASVNDRSIPEELRSKVCSILWADPKTQEADPRQPAWGAPKRKRTTGRK